MNSSTLRVKFGLTKAVARDIVKACSRCVTLIPQPSLGVNPRGLSPNHIWQMDVTHYAEYGKLRFIHVTVDTFSGFITASLHSGEKARDIIAHCLHSFSVLGVPKQLKTDNGPGYTSSTFQQFCVIFKRAHLTLKNALYKQKGGIGDSFRSPKEKLSTVLYILNFLNVDSNRLTAADRHWCPKIAAQPKVLWKDIMSGQWKGPDQVLIWSRGSVCVFPQDATNPIWVPERLVRPVSTAERQDEEQKEERTPLSSDPGAAPGDVDQGRETKNSGA